MMRLSRLIACAALALAITLGGGAWAQDDPVQFGKDIWPILVANCVKCHGPQKQKNDLRMDSPEAIKKGGRESNVLSAGDPDDSFIVELISLPADHDDVMPKKGERLPDEQIALIRRWVAEGANFDGWDEEQAVIEVAAMMDIIEPTMLDELGEDVAAASPESLAPLHELGALAMPLSQDNNLLRVNFRLIGEKVGDSELKLLQPLSANLTWLNLAMTQVTDEGLKGLSDLTLLTNLHLENTDVSDAGLVHLAKLEHLEYLNLYGTQVTDEGLAHLEGLAGLKNLYLWETGVTKEGAAKLAEALPEVDINLGWELEAPAPGEEKKHLDFSALFDEHSCCADAHEKGDACDHECCVAAAAEAKVCLKCNPGAAKRLFGAN